MSYQDEILKLDVAAGRHSMGCIVVPYPWPVDYPGPNGELLAVNTYLLGMPRGERRVRNLFWMIGGTHGPEGYEAFLNMRRLLSPPVNLAELLGPDTAVLLVTPLNAWGYAWGRRVDHRNKDLNRSCMLFPITPDTVEPYAQYADLLHPEYWGPRQQRVLRDLYRDPAKRQALRNAVTPGQSTFAHGLFYRGNGLSDGGKILRLICEYVAQVLQPEKIVVIDKHTGLGESANGELICMTTNTEVQQRTRRWIGPTVRFTKLEGNSVAASAIDGSTLQMVEALVPGNIVPVTLEMGTRVTMTYLIAENSVYHHPEMYSTHQADRFRRELRNAFFPARDRHWEGAAWARTRLLAESAGFFFRDRG